jgi:glycosyltransferase involved in cell wall biosynthesis
MDISIVLPSYNEMRNMKAGVLDDVYAYLSAQKYTWELILTDDGSTDGTLQALRAYAKGKPEVRVLANAHRGKGPTVISALMQSRGDWTLFSDFDQATPLSELEKLLPFTKNYDVVIGSRELKGAERQREPFHRHLMGKVFNLIVRMIAIGGFADTQCGFKLFSRASIAKLAHKVVVYGNGIRKDAFTGAFDVELLYLAVKHGLKVAEVPVHWKHVRTERVNPLKDSFRMFVDILKIRLADIQGKYA